MTGYDDNYVRTTWKAVRACDPYGMNPVRMLWSHAYGRFKGVLWVICDILEKGSQEPVRVPYGFRKVHVGASYGPMRTSYGPVYDTCVHSIQA